MDTTQIKILYSQVFPKFKSWVLKNSGGEEDAHDAFQEVLEMMLIKSKMNKLNITSSLEAYTFQASKYRWIDTLRKRKNQNKVISLEENLHQDERILQDQMQDLEEEKRKFSALDRSFAMISTLCQEILTLIKKGKKPAEIATLVGASNATTINRRKHACMESWRKHYLNFKD